ncbi:hypothetical protein SNE40_014653 [Patella caerulea]|uniref:Uncharacterized protein n=1 Tax=Patella caerulea TaxID=87958 RepID=A0AAN8PDB0_PATCE
MAKVTFTIILLISVVLMTECDEKPSNGSKPDCQDTCHDLSIIAEFLCPIKKEAVCPDEKETCCYFPMGNNP